MFTPAVEGWRSRSRISPGNEIYVEIRLRNSDDLRYPTQESASATAQLVSFMSKSN